MANLRKKGALIAGGVFFLIICLFLGWFLLNKEVRVQATQSILNIARVTYQDSAGQSYSVESSPVYTEISLPGDTQPPTVPTNLTATAISSSQINLSWTASTDSVGVAGYRIYRCQGVGCTPSIQIATSPTNSYSNTGLTASTIYNYQISAYDAAGNESAESNTASATTLAETLSVSLSASPSSGTAPLSGVDLTAVVSGTATGNINHTFYCNRSDSGTNITLPYDAKYDNVSQTTYTAQDICSYSSSGTYYAKVIVERGGYQAENRATITVSSSQTDGDGEEVVTGWNFKIVLQSAKSSKATGTITIYPKGTTNVVVTSNVSSDTGGNITVDPSAITNIISGNNYDIKIKVSGYLVKKVTTTLPPATSINIGQLLAGDYNEDNKVTALDFAIWVASYRKSLPLGDPKDINQDGKVSALDFAIWVSNYRKVGD